MRVLFSDTVDLEGLRRYTLAQTKLTASVEHGKISFGPLSVDRPKSRSMLLTPQIEAAGNKYIVNQVKP
jgi:hypothetical protein